MIQVLLVDDHAMLRAGFRTILGTQPDIEVVGEASTGAEGVELARALRPDVITMDVQMPDMDGLEATRRIVADASLGCAIAIVTTFDRDEYLFDALDAGASGFLLKNAGPEELIAAVRALASGDGMLAPEVTRRVLSRFRAQPAERVPEPVAPWVPEPAAPWVPEPGPRAPEAPGSAERWSEWGVGIEGPDTGWVPEPVEGPDTGWVPEPVEGPDTGWVPEPVEGLQRRASTSSATHTPHTRPAASTGSATHTPGILAEPLTDREAEVLALMADARSNAEIAAALFIGDATVKTHVSRILQKLGARDRVQAVVLAHRHRLV